MRLQYVLSDVAVGLRRNVVMTVAVVITVMVSLALLGTSLLLRAQTEVMKGYWYDKVEISVFLCNRYATGPGCTQGQVTPDQRARILAALEASHEVQTVYYESQQEAYERFQEQFSESTSEFVRPEQLPESYRVKLVDPEQSQGVVSTVSRLPGVVTVEDQRETLGKFFQLLSRLQIAALVVACAQVLVAVLLISNTIRVAAFTRRRETGIMRLVGASRFYIQLPFVLEAAIAGLLGALLASGALALFEFFVVRRVLVPAIQFTAWVDWEHVVQIIPVLLVTGVGMSATASIITLRKYLRV